ncbi:hypothetical protein E2K80_17030 [Rhodophyticola sp. CCM32]|uniref:hypothetical protein n=1 Tax=Rhodophyticola sp. CCM32 TaxID=2916397 RepID=UPI00107F2411|nr:hypothetical protein [Rhodophyticola sp. CCM32]QBY02232.1 hypothetical protein E2K80_17030 [Rhodophyticola sp. CCM32]
MAPPSDNPRSSAVSAAAVATAATVATRAEKARVLKALLGPDRFRAFWKETLGAADLQEADDADLPDQEETDTIVWQRNRLIQRFRDRGFLTADVPEPDLPGPPPTRGAPPPGATALVTRLAENLEDATLMHEHPAVIAHLLKLQGTDLRARVLRHLPGGQARAVMRVLKVL